MSDNGSTPPGAGRDPNATMIIPNPGGRMRQDPSPASPAGVIAQGGTGMAAHLPEGLQVKVAGQSNRILSAANRLITVLSALGNTLSHPNVPQLQQELASEISNLDHALKQLGVRNEEALTARYILCAAIDEAILDTPWGAESGWGGRSLLRVYHNETSGGERFFDLLDQVSARPSEYRELIELFYVLLSLGFRGRYALDPSGDARVETLRERVHQDMQQDIRSERSLSPRDPASDAVQPALRNQIPLWAILSVVAALVLVIYVGLRAWMYSGTLGVVERLDNVYPEGLEQPTDN